MPPGIFQVTLAIGLLLLCSLVLLDSTSWAQSLNCVRLFVTPWIVAHKAPLSMEFSRQEYWSELPFPSVIQP